MNGTHRRRSHRIAARALCALVTCVPLGSALPPRAAAQDGASHRDEWQRVPDILVFLGAEGGAHVADIGAGGGYFTEHLRRAVGDDGRVYAVDISLTEVARLRGRMDREGARNVDVVLGEPDDPRLPFGSLDAALIVNAYHEMTEYPLMLAAIRRALRPGGRLVILDNPTDRPEADRAAQTERHQIALELVAEELLAAGFEQVSEDPAFIAERSEGHDHRMWLLAVRRPLTDPPPQRLAGAPEGPEGLFACPFPSSTDAIADRPSPPDSAEARLDAARVKVCYSRPAMRGRTIMGELVPFGEPWRTGANEATVLRTDRALEVGDVRLEPGWYSLYTIPEREAWTVVVNGLPDRDGMVVDDWVRSHDVGRIVVPAKETEGPIESLVVRFEPGPNGAADLVIEWERTRVAVPLRVAP